MPGAFAWPKASSNLVRHGPNVYTRGYLPIDRLGAVVGKHRSVHRSPAEQRLADEARAAVAAKYAKQKPAPINAGPPVLGVTPLLDGYDEGTRQPSIGMVACGDLRMYARVGLRRVASNRSATCFQLANVDMLPGYADNVQWLSRAIDAIRAECRHPVMFEGIHTLDLVQRLERRKFRPFGQPETNYPDMIRDP